RGVEAARAVITERRGAPLLARLWLWALTTPAVAGVVYGLARALRSSGLPAKLAGWGRLRFAMGMLAASRSEKGGESRRKMEKVTSSDLLRPPPSSSVLLFRGCVTQGLLPPRHAARPTGRLRSPVPPAARAAGRRRATRRARRDPRAPAADGSRRGAMLRQRGAVHAGAAGDVARGASAQARAAPRRRPAGRGDRESRLRDAA